MSGKNQKWLQEHQDHYKRMAEKSMKDRIQKDDVVPKYKKPEGPTFKKMPWTVEDRKNNKLKKMPLDPNNKPKWKFL